MTGACGIDNYSIIRLLWEWNNGVLTMIGISIDLGRIS
jgi:hypothetical protein